MERPIEVELPHKLGRDEAHRRIANNVHRLKDHVPGGAAQVQSNWAGDQLNLDITALGQKVAAQIDVEDTKVRCKVMLPGMLAERGVMPTDYDDWRRIEETEVSRARPGSPREKFVRVEDWLSALGR